MIYYPAIKYPDISMYWSFCPLSVHIREWTPGNVGVILLEADWLKWDWSGCWCVITHVWHMHYSLWLHSSLNISVSTASHSGCILKYLTGLKHILMLMFGSVFRLWWCYRTSRCQKWKEQNEKQMFCSSLLQLLHHLPSRSTLSGRNTQRRSTLYTINTTVPLDQRRNRRVRSLSRLA